MVTKLELTPFYLKRIENCTVAHFHDRQGFIITGSICFNIFVIISSIIWYVSSQKNSKERPNLMRIFIILIIAFYFGQMVFALSLMLLYAIPSTPLTAYPSAAKVICVSYLILALLIFQLNREKIIEKANLDGNT